MKKAVVLLFLVAKSHTHTHAHKRKQTFAHTYRVQTDIQKMYIIITNIEQNGEEEVK